MQLASPCALNLSFLKQQKRTPALNALCSAQAERRQLGTATKGAAAADQQGHQACPSCKIELLSLTGCYFLTQSAEVGCCAPFHLLCAMGIWGSSPGNTGPLAALAAHPSAFPLGVRVRLRGDVVMANIPYKSTGVRALGTYAVLRSLCRSGFRSRLRRCGSAANTPTACR